jgi:DNA ligase-1
MIEDFKLLAQFIEEMNSSNSTNHKVDTLTKYQYEPFIKQVLFYTYHPYWNFGVTSDNLKKRKDLIAPAAAGYDDLFMMLDDLNERHVTGHSALQVVNRFIEDYKEFDYLIYQILDRNLETRATTTLINRVMPNFIPTFEVALAFDSTKVKGVNLLDKSWYVSRKLDGVRCICIIHGESIKFFSRNGKEFHTLGKVADEIRHLGITDCVLDGEICLMNEEGADDFQGILKEIQRKDHTIENPKYLIFDILEGCEFDGSEKSPLFSERIEGRVTWLNGVESSKIISILPQHRILSEEDLTHMKDQVSSLKWEGLMLRRDMPYEPGRSKSLLKIKNFYDAEYQVIEAIMEKQRVIVNEREVEEEVLSAVIIEHKGNRVRVGSGFSMAERREYFTNPEKIVGQTITVQYFEETVDQNGNNSLRFPVFKGNHGKSRSI